MELIHVPVLKKELIANLSLQKGFTVVDGTLGLGGHAKEVLKIIDKDGLLIGFEKDKEALKICKERLKHYSRQVYYLNCGFELMEEKVNEIKRKDMRIKTIDAVYLDLGLSSYQLEKENRGFTFQRDQALDMRFDARSNPLTAEIILNFYTENELARIFRVYGEEKFGLRLSRLISNIRKQQSIKTTLQLRSIIEKIYPEKRQGRHPAQRIFQALRIAVNQEMDVLKQGLESAFQVLRSGGGLAVISYHSIEDRIVKQFFLEKSSACVCPKEAPICICSKRSEMSIITKKPIIANFCEIEDNPRARSAKMRVGEKVQNSKCKIQNDSEN